MKEGRTELIYIGRSGEVKQDGSIVIRKLFIVGLTDRLVNGKQFGEPRRNSWKVQRFTEEIEELDVYWFAAHSDSFADCPRIIENKLLRKYFSVYTRLPNWNNEL